MLRTFTLFLVSILMLSVSTLSAQETSATLSGTVYDNKGATVNGASIVVKHEPTGAVSSTQSNKKGIYTIPNLKTGGPYSIKISFVGFKEEVLNDVQLNLGTNPDLNFNLTATSTELKEVVISSNKNRIPAGSLTVGTKQLNTLPSLSRSLNDFTRLTPQSNNNSFAGSNFRYNNFTLDGAINNDAIGFSNSFGGVSGGGQSGTAGAGTRTSPYSIESVQEVQVQLAPYDVKLGNFTGGSVNAVTKSGTNEIHGSVYGFGRSSFLVGKSPDSLKSSIDSKFYEYQTGFAIGGPIIKNKAFFFINAEETRRQEPTFYNAGDPGAAITVAQAKAVVDTFNARGYFNPGTYDKAYVNTSSDKILARFDYKLDDKNSLMIRAIYTHGWGNNLERTSSNFQFSSTDYTQHTKNTNIVAELKTKVNNNMNNQLIVSYINVHEYRDFPTPTNAAGAAQPYAASSFVDIGNGAWWLGTWREASIYNMKQTTLEVTDNFTWTKGNNKFTFGTHNEFYNLNYGFLNSWNGRWEYSGGWNKFLANTPSRIRSTYYLNGANNRDALYDNTPGDNYNVNLLSAYAQDEIAITKNFKVTPGIRVDYSALGSTFPTDPALASINTYGYTNPNPTFSHTSFSSLNNKWLGSADISPRLGFHWDVQGDNSFVIRGGSGVFVGRMPFAWLGYAATLSGTNYGNVDIKNPGTVALSSDPNQTKAALPASATSKHEVDIVDNNFKLPRILRSNLAFDFRLPKGYKITADVLYSQTLYDVAFQQIAVKDSAVGYTNYGPTQTPIYPSSTYGSNLSNIYMLTNTTQGWKVNYTVQVTKTGSNKSIGGGKSINFGWMAGYTYGISKDVSNGIRNSFQSNYELNPSINPNNSGLAYSNFDLRHRFLGTINLGLNWNQHNFSSIAFFYNAQSGNPYSLIYTGAPFNNKSNAPLPYIPTASEDYHLVDKGTYTAALQKIDLDNFINGDDYLKTRRGQYAERNGLRTPWNKSLDMKITHEFKFSAKHALTLSLDIFNLANLISSDWGKVYFVTNVNNYTANFLGMVTSGTATQNGIAVTTAPSAKTPYFQYLPGANNGQYYTVDPMNSRWQGQFGIKYSF